MRVPCEGVKGVGGNEWGGLMPVTLSSSSKLVKEAGVVALELVLQCVCVCVCACMCTVCTNLPSNAHSLTTLDSKPYRHTTTQADAK